MIDLYEILGVSKTATKEEIKFAYRERSKIFHPDVNNNSNNTDKDSLFIQINKAYKILIDTDKRKEYDATGKVDDSPKKSQRAMIINAIAHLFVGIVNDKRFNIKTENIFKIIIKSVQSDIKEFEQQMNGVQIQIDRYKEAKKRISCKENVENWFELFIENQIQNGIRQIENLKKEKDIGKKIIEFVSNYEYNVDQDIKQGIGQVIFTNTSTTTATF